MRRLAALLLAFAFRRHPRMRSRSDRIVPGRAGELHDIGEGAACRRGRRRQRQAGQSDPRTHSQGLHGDRRQRAADHQILASTRTSPQMPSLCRLQSAADEDVKIYKRLAREKIAPETTENERYKNRRLLALYFDMSAMRPADQVRAFQAAEKFIRTQMTSVDLVAIMRYNAGSVDILQDFTARIATGCSASRNHDRGRRPGFSRRSRMTQAARTPELRLARTTANSTFSILTASSPHFRQRRTCSASSTRRSRLSTLQAGCG